jgi:dTDP-4-amino-4,6-dideoxygalactose transaminase
MIMVPDIQIPAEDLTRQAKLIQAEVLDAIQQVIPGGKYTLGPQVQLFEDEFAAYCQAQFAVGISSGTEALHLALLACGIGPGDEVITVPNTYIATVFAISYTGATPVFVDVNPYTFNLDIDNLEASITPRTRAILPVHLYGQCVDMDPLLDIAQKHNLWVIEDAAHAHGATYKGRRAGSMGHIGCFSFYPSKVLGAYGDGGAVITNDADLFDHIKVLRYMGQHTKYLHEIIGYQQRLDEIQAAILRVKLRHLEGWIERRRQIASFYNTHLADLPLLTPIELPSNRHIYYMYTILTPQRDELMAFLAEQGIQSHIMYPQLVPYQPAYRSLALQPGTFPTADAQLQELLCLPMFPELTDDEVLTVCSTVRIFFDKRSDGSRLRSIPITSQVSGARKLA